MDKDGTNRRVVVILNAQTEMERSWYPGTVHHGVYYYSEAVEENKMSFFAADILSWNKNQIGQKNYIFKDMAPEYKNK